MALGSAPVLIPTTRPSTAVRHDRVAGRERNRPPDTTPKDVDAVDAGTVLTEREEEVVKLIAEGHPSKQIADQLTINVKTVERHRANILEKLGMRDRTELTRYAIRIGLIEA